MAAVLFALLLNCSGAQSPLDLHVIQGQTMGTTFSVKIVKDHPDAAYPQLETDINSMLVEVNRQMSTYIPDSEISQFNQSQDTTWFAISADFAGVLQTATDLSNTASGALDITIGPLVNLWGFGPEKSAKVPSDAAIARARALSGYQHLSVRNTPPAVKKALPGVYCDLSAIAKGFGVDKVASYLDGLGFKNYLVEIGGEVQAAGNSAHGRPWRIGIETPNATGDLQEIVALSNMAMATSGDYRNYFEKDGVRYSHTIDPRTGKPITHKLASVTVLHPKCVYADGIATALNVMGPEIGYEFAVENELAVFMIIRSENGFRELKSPAAEKFFQ